MSDVLPWASKHGAMNKTTGPDVAGGIARGALTCCPHTVMVVGESAAGAAGVCAADGAAVATRTRIDGSRRYGIKRRFQTCKPQARVGSAVAARQRNSNTKALLY